LNVGGQNRRADNRARLRAPRKKIAPEKFLRRRVWGEKDFNRGWPRMIAVRSRLRPEEGKVALKVCIGLAFFFFLLPSSRSLRTSGFNLSCQGVDYDR